MRRLIIELPEEMTQQEREDLADALHDVRQEWAQEDRSTGIFPMPQRELNTLLVFEEKLRQEPSSAPTDDTAQKNRAELFHLMAENPELPVVPMVDSEIVADDDYNRWRGSWGASDVEEYIIGEELIYFRDDSDLYEVDKVLEEMLHKEIYETIETDAEAQEAYAALPWVKAIIVNIDLPD